MTKLNDTDSTAIHENRLLAVKKTILGACAKCNPEKDGEEKPGIALIFPGGENLALGYESQDLRDEDYDLLTDAE